MSEDQTTMNTKDDVATHITEDALTFSVTEMEVAKGRDTIAQEQGRLSARSDTHNW